MHPSRLLSFALFSCLGTLPVTNLRAQTHEAVHHWTYDETGPDYWGSLDPANAACSRGHAQSPIDLEEPQVAALKELKFDYHPATWQIVNNGHTIQVSVPGGNFLIAPDGHRYELVQFHFHHPSEEAIAGQHFDMVIHMVHKDTDGHLAVVAILLAKGAANPVIQTLWDTIPQEEGQTKVLPGALDPSKLLPAQRGYYHFVGSLTTPPCTEGVQWFVMETPTKVSVEEEQVFAKLYPNNARPLQARNGRVVEISK